MNYTEQVAKEIHEKNMQEKRAKNWAAIIAMGNLYKKIFLIIGTICLLTLVAGIIISVLGVEIGGVIAVIGAGIGVIGCGGMTLIANIIQGAKNLKKEFSKK